MSYPRFDDPVKKVDSSVRKVGGAMPSDPIRRALQGVLNRVIGGTSGTSGTGMLSGIGTGGTAGIQFTRDLLITINGRFGTAAAQNNLYLPNGTQAKSTYVKYLVSVGFGTQGTVTAGNEGASSTAAKLPDPPDGHVAIGYMEYATGTAGAFNRFGGGTSGGANVVSGNAAATCGTVNAWENLLHMPYTED